MMKRKFFDGRAIFGVSMSFGIFFNTIFRGSAPLFFIVSVQARSATPLNSG
jgi:hypothetical protein